MSAEIATQSTSPIRRGPRHERRRGRALAVRSGAVVRARGVAARRLASEVGQGTVEYVGLLLLMATILAAIVGAASGLGGNDKIGQKVVNQIGNSIDKAGGH